MTFLLLLGGALSAQPAHAHSIRCFATADGATISGYAWMGSARPKNVPYRVLAPDGAVLHEGRTNEKGEFSFTAKYRVDHEVVVDAGEGHIARFTVSAEELPEDLPAYGAKEEARSDPASAKSAASSATDSSDSADAATVAKPAPDGAAGPSATGASAADLKSMIRSAVAQQLAPLRIQLDEFKAERRIQDVIGGIGYLVGVAGIAFYFLGVRRQEAMARAKEA